MTLRRFRGLIVVIHPQDALNERFGLMATVENHDVDS
jgi:hypothetical protein